MAGCSKGSSRRPRHLEPSRSHSHHTLDQRHCSPRSFGGPSRNGRDGSRIGRTRVRGFRRDRFAASTLQPTCSGPVLTPIVVVMAEMPFRPRLDRLTTAGALHVTGRDQRDKPLAQKLVLVAVAAGAR
jgi:hypothetical protein